MQRKSYYLLAGGILLAASIGCQTGRSPIQVGNNHRASSRVGLNDGGTPQSITGDHSVRQASGRRDAPLVLELGHEDLETERSGWSRLLGRFGKATRVPLPRTDLQLDAEADPGVEVDDDELTLGEF